jgi:hypothetical protein
MDAGLFYVCFPLPGERINPVKKILVLLCLGAFLAVTTLSSIGCDDKPSTKANTATKP